MRKTMFAAILFAALPAGPALAQDLPATRAQLDLAVGQYFTGADRNGDGQLDRAETAAVLGVARGALAQRDQMPFSLETDADGRPRISVDQGGVLNVLYQGVDRNGNDRLSLAEVRAAARERFDGADANRDGKLDKTELAAAKRQFGSIEQAIKAAR